MATPGGVFLRGDSFPSGGDIPRTRTATGALQHNPMYTSPEMNDDDDDDEDDEMIIGPGYSSVGIAPPIKKKMEKAKWSANEVNKNTSKGSNQNLII